jgi:hypothetical protein
MAEVDKYLFSHQEVVEALIKKQGIHEGIWSLYMEFGLAAVNAGPGPQELDPAAIIPVRKIGLQRVQEMTNLSVDAADVNRAQSKTKSAKSK